MCEGAQLFGTFFLIEAPGALSQGFMPHLVNPPPSMVGENLELRIPAPDDPSGLTYPYGRLHSNCFGAERFP